MSVIVAHPYMKTQRLGSVVDDITRSAGDAFRGPLIPEVGMSGMMKLVVVSLPLLWLLSKFTRASRGERLGGK